MTPHLTPSTWRVLECLELNGTLKTSTIAKIVSHGKDTVSEALRVLVSYKAVTRVGNMPTGSRGPHEHLFKITDYGRLLLAQKDEDKEEDTPVWGGKMIHRKVSVKTSGVQIPRGALTCVFDLARGNV